MYMPFSCDIYQKYKMTSTCLFDTIERGSQTSTIVLCYTILPGA